MPKGSGKENPLIVSAEKEGSKNVSFEGGGVPPLPPPGEQPAPPGPGASQASASGGTAASRVNSRFSRTVNSDGSVVWQAGEGLGAVQVFKAGRSEKMLKTVLAKGFVIIDALDAYEGLQSLLGSLSLDYSMFRNMF